MNNGFVIFLLILVFWSSAATLGTLIDIKHEIEKQCQVSK
jgi:hypothetical protein